MVEDIEPHSSSSGEAALTPPMAGNEQSQPPVENIIAGDHASIEEPPETAFFIPDLVRNNPEPESSEPTFVSYTKYSRKRTHPSKFVVEEGAILEPEKDPSQGSTQEVSAQIVEESAMLDLERLQQKSRSQGMVIGGEEQEGYTEKSLEESRLEEKEQEAEPLIEDEPLNKGDKGTILKEVEHDHPVPAGGSTTESETSEELRMKAERRKKSRTLLTMQQREMELRWKRRNAWQLKGRGKEKVLLPQFQGVARDKPLAP